MEFQSQTNPLGVQFLPGRMMRRATRSTLLLIAVLFCGCKEPPTTNSRAVAGADASATSATGPASSAVPSASSGPSPAEVPRQPREAIGSDAVEPGVFEIKSARTAASCDEANLGPASGDQPDHVYIYPFAGYFNAASCRGIELCRKEYLDTVGGQGPSSMPELNLTFTEQDNRKHAHGGFHFTGYPKGDQCEDAMTREGRLEPGPNRSYQLTVRERSGTISKGAQGCTTHHVREALSGQPCVLTIYDLAFKEDLPKAP